MEYVIKVGEFFRNFGPTMIFVICAVCAVVYLQCLGSREREKERREIEERAKLQFREREQRVVREAIENYKLSRETT